ncbi:MAG: methyltransferase domain-containing protein [Saprospiraceae bacterium]|nr:methyltransferase domain-containing protein [Saprospiraceae bacterium]
MSKIKKGNNSNFEFIKEGIKNMQSVGSVCRSSPFVAKSMSKGLNDSTFKIIVELGAGDGAITEEILKNMQSDARLIVLEINENFCDQLRQWNDPRMLVLNESAENLKAVLHSLQIQEADRIISAIPFLLFPREEVEKFLRVFYSSLAPGGKFIQLHYSLNLKDLYEEIFDDVKIRFVPINIPPAFIFECKKKV